MDYIDGVNLRALCQKLAAQGRRLPVVVVGYTMGLGLRVNGALAWVDRSRIVQSSGGGVVAEAQLVLRSCFVGSVGDVGRW